MNKIKRLYDLVYNISRNIQIRILRGEEIDGKSIWQNIEKKVIHIIIKEEIEYNNSLKDLYERMDKLIIKYDLANNEYNPISNHYFLQLKNLVKTKSNFIIQINRILQIAFNAGNLSIFLENNRLNDEIIHFVLENNMLQLDTYVSIDSQYNIDKLISDDLFNI